MLDTAGLKRRLIVSGKVGPEAIEAADDHARASGVSLTRTLVSSQMVSFEDLGRCCAEVTGLPYEKLVPGGLARGAERLLSQKCAKAWRTYPVAFTPADQELTLAVHDPGQMPMLENMYGFFMQPWNLSFTVASDAELDEALRNYPEPETARSSQSHADGPLLFAGALSGGKKEDRRRRRSLGSKEMAALLPRTGPATKGGALTSTPRDTAALGSALVRAIAMLVRTRLAGDFDRLSGVSCCVRYCQLMAARLRLTSVQSDALLMGAWLSALEDRHGVLKEMDAPHRLEELFAVGEIPESERRPEAWILRLVRDYQDVQIDDPDASRDINLTRRELRLRWSSAPEQQDMLETFLQVLMDEKFLVGADKAAGSVLLVDPAESALCSLAPSLAGIGLEIVTAPDALTANKRIAESPPDVIIVDMDLPGKSGLRLCESTKASGVTARLPFLALVDQNDRRLAVESLRAGADDIICKPVDPELLFLKVQRRIAAASPPDAASGVSGPLEEMNFTDMIQILSAGRKDLEILLAGSRGRGSVVMRDGNIIHAAAGERKGEEAFYELMQWEDGEFTTRRCVEFPERTIDVSTMSLLMEGARRADEEAGGGK